MLNLTSKVKNDNPLTGRTFRVTMASFFLANIMTVLGTVIDGFVIGNTMDDNSIAAAGFVSPAIILFAFVGATVGIGFQSGSVSSLCRGDAEGEQQRNGGGVLSVVTGQDRLSDVAGN